eukprot:2652172-Rhodomonas_salina.3
MITRIILPVLPPHWQNTPTMFQCVKCHCSTEHPQAVPPARAWARRRRGHAVTVFESPSQPWIMIAATTSTTVSTASEAHIARPGPKSRICSASRRFVMKTRNLSRCPCHYHDLRHGTCLSTLQLMQYAQASSRDICNTLSQVTSPRSRHASI